MSDSLFTNNTIQNNSDTKATTNTAQGFDMNSIIAQQSQEVGFSTPTTTPTETSHSFDINSLLNGASSTNDMTSNVATNPGEVTPVATKEEAKVGHNGFKIVKITVFMLIVLVLGYGLFFAARIFYPVEIESLTNNVSQLLNNLSANILGTSSSDETVGDTVIENTTNNISNIDDGIATPIADSITNSQGIESNIENTIATTDQVQGNWDTILPETGSIINENTVLPAPTSSGNIVLDSSFDDLESTFGVNDTVTQEYISQLLNIQSDIALRVSEYEANSDQRGLTITRTINKRIDELIQALEESRGSSSQTGITQTIEADIVQLNQLLDALDQ